MIIDTNKLRITIDDHYAKLAENADKIKSDRDAIRAFTRLETEQMNNEKIIDAIETLNKQYFA
jgi:hypothetical protein